MYTATFPVHIKFRIKRKAVPSCLLPRLPLRVLPRLRLWTQDQMSPFSWAGGTHSDVRSVGLTLAEVFFWDWRRGRRITKEMTYVWIIVHSCGGSLAAADEQTNIWLPCNNCFSTCNRSVEHTEVISLNTFALPVINSNLVPIVPRGGICRAARCYCFCSEGQRWRLNQIPLMLLKRSSRMRRKKLAAWEQRKWRWKWRNPFAFIVCFYPSRRSLLFIDSEVREGDSEGVCHRGQNQTIFLFFTSQRNLLNRRWSITFRAFPLVCSEETHTYTHTQTHTQGLN